MTNTDFTEDQTFILKSEDMGEAVYDLLEEKKGNLHYDEARTLIETPYVDILLTIDEDIKTVIFDTAAEEAGAFSYDVVEGEENWIAVFNEYRDYIAIVREVRAPSDSEELVFTTTIGKEVAEAANPMNIAFAEFRKNRNMSEETAREIMAASYRATMMNVSQLARDLAFKHAFDRYSELGTAEVFNDLGATITLMQLATPDPEDAEIIRESLEARVQREQAELARPASDE